MGHLRWGVLAVLILLWGCGGGNSGGELGALKVSMTDAPTCGIDQVNLTVSKVRVHPSANANENDAGWTDLNITPGPKKINLTALTNGVMEDLGQTGLLAGHYAQLRLVLLPNTPAQPLNNSVVINSVETAIDLPRDIQSGIKLIYGFDAAFGKLVDLVLDFDACRSIVNKGNGGYTLKPVVTAVPQDVSGKIAGKIAFPPFESLVAFHPIVYAEQGGQVVKSTIPDDNGAFVLSPLQQSSTAGDYIVVIVEENTAIVVIASVPVTAQQTTTINDSAHPIALNVSSAHTISGAILPSDAEPTVRAIQSFLIVPHCPSGSICEASLELVSLETHSISATGNYTLALPVGAPWLGSYFAGTPIALAQQADLAGKYNLEVSAQGFSTQAAAVDLRSADVIQNFTLTP